MTETTPKPPSNVVKYSRKSALSSPISKKVQRIEESSITDENFALKVLQVLITPAKPILTEDEEEGECNELDSNEFELREKKARVRNVHELLESGGVSRLHDELEYLVTGLEAISHESKPSAMRQREAYILDLSKKLYVNLTSMSMSAVRSSGLLERIIESLPLSEEMSQKIISVLLYTYCADVRRIDHFIKLEDAISLISHLLTHDLTTVFEFGEPKMDRIMGSVLSDILYVDLGLWLLAKLMILFQTSSSDISDRLVVMLRGNPSIIETCCQLAHPIEKTRLLRIMLVLEVASSFDVESAVIGKSLIHLLETEMTDLLKQHSDILLVIIKILIQISGPDTGAAYLITLPNIMDVIESLLCFSLQRVDDPNLLSMSLTLAINLIDRNESNSLRLKSNRTLITAFTENLHQKTSSFEYIGLLLAILFQGDQLLNREFTSLIASAVHRMNQSLETSGRLTDELKSQLTSLHRQYS